MFAQNNITSSPYSLHGIGDPLSLNNTMGFSMGDVKYALDRPFYLNYANPASYSSLIAPTFSVGVLLNRTRSFTGSSTQDNDNGTLRYFGLGMPLTPRLSMAFGARPYTSLGFVIEIESAIEYPSNLFTRYEGQGGLNIAFLGLSYEVIKDTIHSLNVGINGNLYFGNNKETSLNQLDYASGALSSMFLNNSVTSDVGFDIGLIYSVNMSKLLNTGSTIEHTMTLGGTYSIPTYLRTRFEDFSGAYFKSNAVTVITDTLYYLQDTSAIYLPPRYGVGINYQIFNRHSKTLWILEADYETTKWSELRIRNKKSGLTNSERYSFGAQFIPNANGIRGFFSLLRYRVGLNYGTTRIYLLGHQVTDVSASLGFGIPLVKSKSVYASSSTIDFGVVVGSRGTTEKGLVREQYTNLYIGLSFSPNFWDRWLKKRKIN